MSNYTKGRSYEYKVIKELEKQSYYCIRSAGSHKVCDIVAFLQKDGLELSPIKIIQVKSGKSPYKQDLKKIAKLHISSSVAKELWLFRKKCQPPEIISL